MDVSGGKELVGSPDEVFNMIVIFFATDSFVTVAKIEIVVEKLFVVGACVKDDSECAVRVDAGADSGKS